MKYSASILICFLALSTGISQAAYGQATNSMGIEIQVYPAGVILGLRGHLDVGNQQEVNLGLGYNITRRGDFGKHDNEEGGGPGISFGYRYYFKDTLRGLFLGGRTDLWLLDIDWRDDNPPRSGNTEITVFQPTLEGGYNLLNNSSTEWVLAPTVSFGYEINIHTEGEPVGEGAILLGGLNAAYRF